MPNIQERLDQAVTVAETASQKLHQTVNGGETETVTVESGEISTVAKAIKDIRDTILSNTNNLVEQAQNAAQEAVSAVDEAKQTLADTKNYVDSAKEEISTASTSAVENIQNQVSSAETRIDNKINQAEQSLDTTISSAVDEVKEAALSTAQSAIDNVTEDVTQAASAKIDTYVQTNIQPQIDNYIETNSYPAIDNYIETTTKPNIDEHTAALDPRTAKKVLDLTNEIVNEQMSIMSESIRESERKKQLNASRIGVGVGFTENSQMAGLKYENNRIEYFGFKRVSGSGDDYFIGAMWNIPCK